MNTVTNALNRSSRQIHAILLVGLLALNVAVKITLWAQTPQTFPDSLGYIAPAMRLLDRLEYGTQENAFRTPTYPLFIAVLVAPFQHTDLSECREARVPACLGEAQQTPQSQMNLRVIVLAQIVLGMLTILLVYWFAWRIARNAWIATLCALSYPLDLSTGYWEISILSETVTSFLVMLVVCLTLCADFSTPRRRLAIIMLGFTLGALAFAHLTFLLFAIVPAIFLYGCRLSKKSITQAMVEVVPVLIIPVLIIFSWSVRNYLTDGSFTPSSVTGYNLTRIVGAFMEKAPAEYRDLADIYLEYRAERIAVHGSPSSAIFFAYRDMMVARNTTWAGLSRELTAMSMQMILEHPLDYVCVFGESFQRFWTFGLGKQNSSPPSSFEWVKWFFDSRLQQAWMVLFFLAPIALAVAQLKWRSENNRVIWIWFAIITVAYAAFVSSAFIHADNERYRTTIARLQYSAIVLTAWYVSSRKYSRAEKSVPHASADQSGGSRGTTQRRFTASRDVDHGQFADDRSRRDAMVQDRERQ